MFHLAPVSACASREFSPDGDLMAVFERLRTDPCAWLLDSALPSARLGRFCFAGSDPYLVMRARGSRIELDCRRAVRPGLAPGRSVCDADPLDVLRSLLPPPPVTLAPVTVPFVGGAVGYLGYELADRIEDFAFGGIDDLGLPDLYFLFVDRLLAFDCIERRFSVHALGFGASAAAARGSAETAADEFLRRLAAGARPATARVRRTRQPRGPFAFFDESSYAKSVDTAKQEIAAGNAYQVCLTHRMERDYGGDPWELYRRLREANPAPFASYFELPEVAIASSSPERFLRLSADRGVESRPIKGTLPRCARAGEDTANRRRLARSPKDRAENLMIVDLVRNDLGRVCETGSVVVSELMSIEAYASVFQMVSSVCGRLLPGRDAIDLIRATFPPGSMTGAPKIAAMRILDRLEPVRRGVYSGALGYLDARGGADLCVVIRTILVKNQRAYVYSGGGIVADSDPVGEYRETLDKARPLIEALEETRSGRCGFAALRPPDRRRWK